MNFKVDQVYICNQALMELGVDTSISSLDEKSVYAERCNRLYDSVLRGLLSQYSWSFAEKLVNLSRLEDEVLGYSYGYSYPQEAFRINNVYASEEDYKAKKTIPELQNFTVSNVDGKKCILSNSEIIVEPNIVSYPESFVRVFVLKLAEQLSKVSGTPDDIRNRIKEDFSYELSIAMMNSYRENDNRLIEDNPYVDVRG